jgi:polar amino acid transport system substrate-binding protein
LEQKPYFLMLSHALVVERPVLAAALWSEIERQRDSARYQMREMEFFRQR